MTGLRIIVCGGRDFTDFATIRRTLNALHEGPEGPISHLFHGNARGADTEAHRWAEELYPRAISLHPVPAQWTKHGRHAGPIRNKAMLGNNPDLVLAFPGGKGTEDMKRQARNAGVRVVEVTVDWLGNPIGKAHGL